MKNGILVIILLFNYTLSHSQSKYGFNIGLDTLASKYGIKSKVETVVKLDSIGRPKDTISYNKTKYNTLGFITKYEESQRGYVDFTYNEQGYLIYESLNWRGAIGSYGEDTTLVKEVVIWEQFNNTKREKESIVIYNYGLPSKYQYRQIYKYGVKGELKSIETYSDGFLFSNVKFHYNDKNILIGETENRGDSIFKTTFEYEFY